MRNDVNDIIQQAIYHVLPDEAVKRALHQCSFNQGRVFVLGIGKAAWQMAHACYEVLENRITQGMVITKYDHVKGDIPRIVCYEAGHPVPDEHTFFASCRAIEMVSGLKEEDTLIFLISGGGSSLFEVPLVDEGVLRDVTQKLLRSGASITEINTIRKRLSKVKGGKFAKLCEPAQMINIVLSDIIHDPLDMIASGPTYPDATYVQDVWKLVRKYDLIHMGIDWKVLLQEETPKELDHVQTYICGSVKQLAQAAKKACEHLGYTTTILCDDLNVEARDAGYFFAQLAISEQSTKKSVAYILAGETVVHVRGDGLGGRNQELVLSAAPYLKECKDTVIFSIGSDGTDGPTDAAGGYVDASSYSLLQRHHIDVDDVLANNDAYHALKQIGGLIQTGATGTNVNDISVLLIKR